MSNTVISAEGIGKSYIIGHQQQERYVALRDVITNGAKQLWSRLRNPQYHTHNEMEKFWALKDVNFEIKQGDRIGIIGRNGAGKSTLLKILSRITVPTTGRVKISGRVASLLEVGTGFHPELTGRENIFLNGAILGMQRKEIKKKFDEIVAFAEVEKFLDTPVKRYSSGMYVRLAFAVAAHMEPEILIIDEVLAVGDAQFQKKCLGKMEEVGKEGRTVLFVSHNLPMIASLCEKAILLESGLVKGVGESSKIILSYYSASDSSFDKVDYAKKGNFIGDDFVRLISGELIDENGENSSEFDIRKPIKIKMIYEVFKASKKYTPNFHVKTMDGIYIFVSGNFKHGNSVPGRYQAECTIPGCFLNDGAYSVGLAITSLGKGTKVHFYEQNALNFNINDPVEDTLDEYRFGYSGRIPGVVRPQLQWKVSNIS